MIKIIPLSRIGGCGYAVYFVDMQTGWPYWSDAMLDYEVGQLLGGN